MARSRVYLDAVKRSDLPAFAQWFNDPELLVTLNPGVLFPNTEEDEEKWYDQARQAQAQGRGYTFAIRLREDHRLIGSTGLFGIDAKNRSATFGIAVADPQAQGQGYGREATELVLRFGFDELNLHRIQLNVFAFNDRAIRLYRSVGFQEEGRQRDALFRGGRYHDCITMALLEDEFRKLYPHREGLIFLGDR